MKNRTDTFPSLKIRSIINLPLITLLLFTISCKTIPNEAIAQNTIYIDSLKQAFETPNPSVSYMVIKKGKVVLEKSLGYANIDLKEIATSQTNYRIASVSKPFTAVGIQKLIFENKLKYTTTLSEIFPDFPEYGDNITIEHLLSHRSGIINYDQFIVDGEQLSDEDVLAGMMSINSINSYPNEVFAYRNSGYALLAQIIEKITGQEFEDYMQKEVFQVAGMRNTSLYMKGKEIQNRAMGYTITEDEINLTDQNATTAVKGDGCIYSSLSDFFFWDQALYSDKLIPPSFLEAGLYGFDKDGKTDKKGYGYGWEINYNNGFKIVEHTGASIGFTNHYVRVPELELSVVLFTNRNHNYYNNLNFTNMAYSLIQQYSDGQVNLVE